MIISASYKTDIPAFYGEWFCNRLAAGYCKMVNPYNRKAIRVDLSRDKVDGFVFWTKNIGPFFDKLDKVRKKEFPFVIQYTVNNYPRELEYSVVNAERSTEHMKQLATQFGPNVAVWRYDTILFTSLTPIDFHRKNFESLAQKLEGTTDEVVVSFAQIYAKTLHNLKWASEKFGFMWEDPEDEVKYNLAAELAAIAKSYGMQLRMCSQKSFLAPGVEEARCVDAERLTQISGRPLKAKIKGNRPECGCYASRDIGEYDTCPHGCVYCYAVRNRDLAQKRYKEHDPLGEFLFTPSHIVKDDEKDQKAAAANNDLIQLKLF
jgi:hypothetical protein